MAAELTITIWTEGPVDAGLAKTLGDAACQTILNTSGGAHRAAVVNAQSHELPLYALSQVIAPEAESQTTPLASPVPAPDPLAAPELPVSAISPFELPATLEPQPTNADGSAIPTPDAVVPTIADWMAAAGQPVAQVSPGVVEIVEPQADAKPVEVATAEAVPPAVDAATSATSEAAPVHDLAGALIDSLTPTAAELAETAAVMADPHVLEAIAEAEAEFAAKAALDANGTAS